MCVIFLFNEFHESWYEVRVDHDLYGGAILDGQDFSDSDHSVVLFECVIWVNASLELDKLSDAERFFERLVNIIL